MQFSSSQEIGPSLCTRVLGPNHALGSLETDRTNTAKPKLYARGWCAGLGRAKPKNFLRRLSEAFLHGRPNGPSRGSLTGKALARCTTIRLVAGITWARSQISRCSPLVRDSESCKRALRGRANPTPTCACGNIVMSQNADRSGMAPQGAIYYNVSVGLIAMCWTPIAASPGCERV